MTTATAQTNVEQRETAAQIAQRIAKLSGDREALEQQAATARTVLAELRALLVTGDVKLGDVAVQQARASTLEGAIGDADDELTRLRLELAEARQREEQEATAARVRALLAERASLQEEFNAAARELDEACARWGAKLYSFAQSYAEVNGELADLAQQAGDQSRANLYLRDKGCRWPALRFPEQVSGSLTRYGQQEERRLEEQRRAARR